MERDELRIDLLNWGGRLAATVAGRLGRYELGRELGRGTMGVVYEALDPALGRSVALKTVHAALALSAAEREAFEQRFLTEARTAAGLSHPGIVVVHDVGRDEQSDTMYIALELLQGRTLSEVMSGGRALPWPEALRLATRVAEALHHAHERGVVHRDVKPANVMVLASGEPKLMDFGIAKVPAGQLTGPGEFFGTPSYMSPEQAGGTEVDARSDVFSLGAVLFLMLTGRRAFDGPNVPSILARVAHRDPPRPSSFGELPEPSNYLVARALAKLPAQRYPTARHFAEDLEDVRSGQPPRHRAGWVEPPRQEYALLELDTARESPTAELTGAPRGRHTGLAHGGATRTSPPPRRPRRATTLAFGGLALAAALLTSQFRPERVVEPEGPPPATPRASAPGVPSPATKPAPTPSSAPIVSESATPRWPWSPKPGRLEVDFAHSLKSGVLRVWVDDERVLEETLQGKVTKKILFVYKKREGDVSQAIEVAPGEHAVRVEVVSEGERWSNRISARFESGVARRLVARLAGGFLEDKQVELFWGRSTSAS